MSVAALDETCAHPASRAVLSTVSSSRGLRIPLLIAALALGGAACGGDEAGPDGGAVDGGSVPDSGIDGPDEDLDQWADDVDNCPSLANPEQRDRDRDGIGDACDVCPTTPNGGFGGQPGPEDCEQLAETEPNNVVGQGQLLMLKPVGSAVEVAGTIEAPSPDGDQAFDRYQVMVGAQTMMRVRVARASPLSLLEPLIIIEGDGLSVPREAEGLFVAERYVYFASAGTYTVSVADRRGVRDATPYGNLDYAYGLSVQAVDLGATSRTPPVNAEPFTLDETGEVFVFDVALEASDFTLIAAETDLDLLTEGVDTILIFEREDGTVIENDSLAEGYSDARIIADLQSPEQVRIVLDHARIYGPGEHEVRLTIDQPDTTRELEPNDTPGLASELVFPGETSGNIKAPLDPDVGPPDLDWYFIDGRAGQVVALTGLIRPAAVANPIMGLVKVYDLETDDFEFLYLNTDSSGDSPRIEAILPEAGRYYVVVGDEQNLGDPPFAGGPLFEYGIFAEATGIQPDPNIVTSTGTMNGVLDPGGRLKRHLVITTEPTLLILETDAMGEEVLPYYRVYGPGARGVLGEGQDTALAYLPGAETYVVGVHNANNGLGGPDATYRTRVSYQSVTATAEAEPNDEFPAANPLGAVRDVITGEVADDTDVDLYTFTATGGLTLDAVLSEGGREHRVRVLDGAGTVVGLGNGGVTGVAIPAPDTYFIAVDSMVPGPYTLIMRLY